MSAYIVDRAHIDALVQVAARGPRDDGPRYPGDGWHGPYWRGASIRPENVNDVARDLLRENVKSVQYRYNDETADTLPGPRPPYWMDIDDYHVATTWPVPTIIQALKLIDCYEYQSCEHPGWRASDAAIFCDGLRSSLIGRLPGYDAAPWGWPPEPGHAAEHAASAEAYAEVWSR